MAWMSDEAWEMVSDSIDKKKTARSARSTRTHCGKRGAVKFPSDYLSKKERNAMNGDVKSYRMNEPMSWDEFVAMPLDLQRKYIGYLRAKFNAPDQHIAEMFGKTHSAFIDHLFRLKMSTDKWMEGDPWDSEGFAAWRLGVDAPENKNEAMTTEDTIDILDRPMTFDTFKTLTDEQKKEYIERLRKKFDVPNKYIGKMMGCSEGPIGAYSKKLNIGYARPPRCHRAWDKAGWEKWLKGEMVETAEPAVNNTPHLTERDKERLDEFVKDLAEHCAEVTEGVKARTEKKTPTTEPKSNIPVIPDSGSMVFEGNVNDILSTIGMILNGSKVVLEVKWKLQG